MLLPKGEPNDGRGKKRKVIISLPFLHTFKGNNDILLLFDKPKKCSNYFLKNLLGMKELKFPHAKNLCFMMELYCLVLHGY